MARGSDRPGHRPGARRRRAAFLTRARPGASGRGKGLSGGGTRPSLDREPGARLPEGGDDRLGAPLPGRRWTALCGASECLFLPDDAAGVSRHGKLRLQGSDRTLRPDRAPTEAARDDGRPVLVRDARCRRAQALRRPDRDHRPVLLRARVRPRLPARPGPVLGVDCASRRSPTRHATPRCSRRWSWARGWS